MTEYRIDNEDDLSALYDSLGTAEIEWPGVTFYGSPIIIFAGMEGEWCYQGAPFETDIDSGKVDDNRGLFEEIPEDWLPLFILRRDDDIQAN